MIILSGEMDERTGSRSRKKQRRQNQRGLGAELTCAGSSLSNDDISCGRSDAGGLGAFLYRRTKGVTLSLEQAMVRLHNERSSATGLADFASGVVTIFDEVEAFAYCVVCPAFIKMNPPFLNPLYLGPLVHLPPSIPEPP